MVNKRASIFNLVSSPALMKSVGTFLAAIEARLTSGCLAYLRLASITPRLSGLSLLFNRRPISPSKVKSGGLDSAKDRMPSTSSNALTQHTTESLKAENRAVSSLSCRTNAVPIFPNTFASSRRCERRVLCLLLRYRLAFSICQVVGLCVTHVRKHREGH